MKAYIFETQQEAQRLANSIYDLGHDNYNVIGTTVITTEEIYDDIKAAYHILDSPIVAEIEQ